MYSLQFNVNLECSVILYLAVYCLENCVNYCITKLTVQYSAVRGKAKHFGYTSSHEITEIKQGVDG